jgi:hypothetical protein
MTINKIQERLSYLLPLKENLYHITKLCVQNAVFRTMNDSTQRVLLNGVERKLVPLKVTDNPQRVSEGRLYIPVDELTEMPTIALHFDFEKEKVYTIIWKCEMSSDDFLLDYMDDEGQYCLLEIFLTEQEYTVNYAAVKRKIGKNNYHTPAMKYYANTFSFRESVERYFKITKEIDALCEQIEEASDIILTLEGLPPVKKIDLQTLKIQRNYELDKREGVTFKDVEEYHKSQRKILQ